jgi:periplasmic divalent cation tolerance protein
MSQLHLVISSCPDRKSAETLARLLVEEKVAACVSLLPGATSFYIWEDRLNEDTEVLLLAKTASAQVGPLMALLAQKHPYRVPEIIALAADAVHPPYLQWVLQCTESH